MGDFQITTEEVNRRFRNHPPVGHVVTGIGEVEDTSTVLDDLTELFVNTGLALIQVLPESREKSTALTKLEECSMWSKAAVARNQQ